MNMLNDLQSLMLRFQGLGYTLMFVMLCVALLILWNDLRRLRAENGHLFVQTQKALRELGQQRYTLATLRQAIIKPDVQVSEYDILDEALTQLDDLLKNLAVEDKSTEQSNNFDDLKERDILSFVRKALRNNQIAVATQPIKVVSLGQTRFYEVFSRVQVGKQYIPAGKFISIAKDNGLVALIDQAFLLKTLELIQRHVDDDVFIAYFCNLSAASFSNKKMIDIIIRYLEMKPRLSSRLIFELTQADTFNLGAGVKKTIGRLTELGCRFSMDNVKMLGLDVDRLRDLRVSFVKFNVDSLIKEIDDPAGRRRWQRTRNLLASQGVEIIVEKVENSKQLDKLRDSGFDYAQGYFFGAPEIIA